MPVPEPNKDKIRHQPVARAFDLQSRLVHCRGGRIVFDHDANVLIDLKQVRNSNVAPIQVRRKYQIAAVGIDHAGYADTDSAQTAVLVSTVKLLDMAARLAQRDSRLGRCRVIDLVGYLAAKGGHPDLRAADAEVHPDKIILIVNERQHTRFASLPFAFESFLADHTAVDKGFYIFGDGAFVYFEAGGYLRARDGLRRTDKAEQETALFLKIAGTGCRRLDWNEKESFIILMQDQIL